MATRRRSDRVVGSSGDGRDRFGVPSGTLPRRTYRDIEHGLSYSPALPAVYQERGSRGRMPAWSLTPSLFYPAEQPLARPRVGRVFSWLPFLNRMPMRVKFCVQRKVRRQVLFAFRRAGYSGSARKAHWNRSANSNYGC